jgi:alpha-N-arabinofuranosidase
LGTFQIQNSGGAGTIASGTNHRADTDWVEIAIDFETPSNGKIRVAPFFVGFGKGTGAAWFDDLSIEELDAPDEPIKITREPLPGRINPLQYGQFIEYLCDLVPSMWAEKLFDGSFEGLTPYKMAFIRETDFKEKPWALTGDVQRAKFSRDTDTAVSGVASQRISAGQTGIDGAGVSQEGIALAGEKVPCQFSAWFKQEGITAPVKVRLHKGATELASCAFQPGREWKKFSDRLVSPVAETNATLSITFTGPGTLWIDNASLMPEDNIRGWRPDVVAAVKALKPGVIRFGGSALDDAALGEFEWKDTIGDPDKRKPFRAWGGLQPTGPGLEEIVQFCELVDAMPLICVRFSNRKPKDAFEQVEYFNGAIDTPMGAWRARNGHPEPYRIKYWQVGNERAGADYEANLAGICQSMLKADPSITLLSSYPTKGVISRAGEWIQYVCPHQYDCANLIACEHELDATRAMIKEYAPGKSIKVAVTEWNTTAGHWGPTRAMLWNLENALACSRYHNLMHRYADLIDIANRSNLVNSFCSGIIQTDNHRLYNTPTYYAQWLYSTRAGNQPLRIESKAPNRMLPDVSATLSADRSKVILFAINPTRAEMNRTIDLSAFGGRGQECPIWTLADTKDVGDPSVTNSFDEPQRIALIEARFKAEASKFEYRFPALSLTAIEWSVEK